MRRRLFDWHLTLGLFGGSLMLVWSLSGALMALDPVLRRAFDAPVPGVALGRAAPESFRFPPAGLAAQGVEGVALRTFGGRSFYQVLYKGGRVSGFDAATGAETPGELGVDEARAGLDAALGGRGWRTVSVERLTLHDDQYRSGELPVLRAVLSGPGEPWVYLSARDGSTVKSVTRMARVNRWLGFGVHTWNAAVFKRAADGIRRWGLSLLVALPLAALAGVSLALYWQRWRSRRNLPPAPGRPARPGGRAARVVAALSAAALLFVPVQGAAQAVVRVPAAARGVGRVPALAVSGAAPSRPRALPPPPLAAPGATHALPRLPAAAVAPAAAAASAARPALAASLIPGVRPAAAVLEPFVPAADGGVRGEAASGPGPAARLDAVFDGAAPGKAPADAVGVLPGGRRNPRLAPSSGAPPAEDRKALTGLYVTHGAHLATMSAAWRVAWPLLAIDLVGKGGLAAVGSFGAILETATGLAAGVIVDRLLPRRSMAAAAVLRAVLGAGIAAAAGLGLGSVPLLLGAFVAHSFALTTIHIGQSSAAPEAVGGDKGALQRVNAVLKIVTAAVSIPGALAGGWLAASYGAGTVLLGYAAANLLVLAPLYWTLLPKTAAPRAASAPAAAGGLWEAARLVAGSRVLLAALAAMAAGVLLVEPLRSVTLPIMLADLAPATAALLLGGFQAAYSGGQLVGNLALVRWGAKLPERAWLWSGAAGMAAFSLFVLGGSWVGFAFAAAAAVGLLTQPLSVAAKTLYQTEVRRLRPDLLGRAMGLNNIAYRLAVAAGTALVGWTAVTGGAWGLGATATLAAVYGALAVATMAGVGWLLGRPAPPRAPSPSEPSKTAKLGGWAPLALMGLSALDWHMALGALTGVVMVYMAVTGAVTVLAPLLKKRFEPRLPKAAPPPPAPPAISAAEAKAKAEAWLTGSAWSLAGEPEFMRSYDEHYRSGELPVYRVALAGPGGFIAYLSGRDGRTVAASSRLARVLRWTGLTLHTFGFGLLKSRYDTARRLAIPVVVALPVVLTVLAAMLSRFL